MSAVLETYFQTVVVDKLNETISKQFEEMKDELQVLKELKSDYSNLRTELDTLKERFASAGDEINEMLAKKAKPAAPKPAVKKAASKKPAPKKKLVAKKKAVKKKAKKK